MSLLPPAAIRHLFVQKCTDKYARAVADFRGLQELVVAHGGVVKNDHGAIRTADPMICALFVRAARVMGLRRELSYSFKGKKLESFDLQVIGDDHEEFKIFVSQVDLPAFPADIAALIEADCDEQRAAIDFGALEALIDKSEESGGLSEADSAEFVGWVVNKLMNRNGPPLRADVLRSVAAVSGEAASALALGPDFNHITIDVRSAGFEGIEQMAELMQQRGFRLLPAIQGAKGTKLRQTATLAAMMATPVRERDGTITSAQVEKQFVEIIERNQAVDADGAPLWRQDGRPLIFRNFLAANADKIFEAASMKSTDAGTC